MVAGKYVGHSNCLNTIILIVSCSIINILIFSDSLGGNSKTIMVANIGPSSFNCDETLTTLRYASRAKKIHNKPKINQDPKDAILREYQEDIARLKVTR